MGEIHPFTPEKLIAGILTTRSDQLEEVEKVLVREFGPVDYRSSMIPFTYTDYYNAEMGPGIRRFFLSFEELVPPDRLAGIKIRTNQLEERFLEEGKRKTNIDPGLLSLGKLILASTKDNAQRIPLSRGIFAEITLIYTRKQYRPLPWTYRDYQSPEYLQVLHEIRDIYKQQIESL